MIPIRIEWERHPKDKRPAHEAQWTAYIDGQFSGVPERPWERAYMLGFGLSYAFRDYVVRDRDGGVTRLYSAMRYYVSW